MKLQIKTKVYNKNELLDGFQSYFLKKKRETKREVS